VRILLVSQMYPGPRAPELGTFVADLEEGLAARGHELARAVVDTKGERLRHLSLAHDVVTAARRFRPDVVYAHFLVPAGLLAVLGTRAPVVLTAHGQDVANAERSRAVRAATRVAVGRAAAVVAVSNWLRGRLDLPEIAPRTRRIPRLDPDPNVQIRLILLPTLMSISIIFGVGTAVFLARRS